MWKVKAKVEVMGCVGPMTCRPEVDDVLPKALQHRQGIRECLFVPPN